MAFIQADLTLLWEIGILAIRENIDTREVSAAVKSSGGPCWPRDPTRWTPPVRGSSWVWNGPGLRESGWVGLRY